MPTWYGADDRNAPRRMLAFLAAGHNAATGRRPGPRASSRKREETMRAASPVRSIAAEAPVTAQLAERASALRYEDLPDDVCALARQCVLDWLAVTLAGSREELSRILAEQAIEEGGKPVASLIGR